MDGGAWKAAVHGVAEGWTRLSDFTFNENLLYSTDILYILYSTELTVEHSTQCSVVT